MSKHEELLLNKCSFHLITHSFTRGKYWTCIWSGWDRVYFPWSSPPSAVLALVAGRVLLITRQDFGQCWAALHSISAVSPTSACHQWARGGQGLLRAHNQDSWTRQTKGIPYCMVSAQQWKLRQRKWGDIYYYGVCPPEQSLCVLKPYFLGNGWTLPTDGKLTVNLSFFFAFALLDCFCLNPCVFLHVVSTLLRRAVKRMVWSGTWQLSKVNAPHHTTPVLAHFPFGSPHTLCAFKKAVFFIEAPMISFIW